VRWDPPSHQAEVDGTAVSLPDLFHGPEPFTAVFATNDLTAIDLLEVLDAERTQLQAQDAFAASRTRSATGAVSLYVALAGGWPQALPLRESVGKR
jgi:hypothetical protein